MSLSKKRANLGQASCGASLNCLAKRSPAMSRTTSERYVESRARPSKPFSLEPPSASSEVTTCRNAASPSEPSPSSFATIDHSVVDVWSRKRFAAPASPESNALTSDLSNSRLEDAFGRPAGDVATDSFRLAARLPRRGARDHQIPGVTDSTAPAGQTKATH